MVRRFAIVGSSVLAMACASSGAVPRPFPVPGNPGATATVPDSPDAPSAPSSVLDGYSLSSTALSLRGAPYRNGGSDPAGFDCSGFVQYVFGQHGMMLPREVSSQFALGRSIAPASLVPGDLVFFSTVSPGASHVGIAIGGDQFVHAPSARGVVRVEALSSSYWSQRFIGARRVGGG
jgi:cell wall-associated NlpC family hydrolase